MGARKTGGSGTPPLRKEWWRPGLLGVGETWRRRDAWADCGDWLRVAARRQDGGWPKRRTLRLQGYDYSQAGAYAVTICTHGGAFLFGRVSDGRMELSGAGRLVDDVWSELPAYYRHVSLDAFVVMPDHMHGVIVLEDRPLPAEVGLEAGPAQLGGSVGSRPEDGRVGDAAPTKEPLAGQGRGGIGGSRPEDGRVGDAAPTKTLASGRQGLSEVVRGFKSMSGRRVNALRGTPGVAVWQRGFYEHVVRNDEDLNRIREYVAGNPVRWWLKREGESG